MYWQLPWWILALLLLRLTTRTSLGRQEEPAEGRTLITVVPSVWCRLKGGDSFLSASNISPLLLRSQIIRLSNWILMDRAVLSAHRTAAQSPEAEQGEQFICRQPDCPWHGLEGCDITVQQGAQTGSRVSDLLLSPLGGETKTVRFSGEALHPPITCHWELPVKMMAAYWFHLSLHRSISDPRKQVTRGRFTAEGKVSFVLFPLRLYSFLQQNPYRECRWRWSEKARPVINVIAPFLPLSSATICVSAYSSKNNQILCPSVFLWLFDARNTCNYCNVSLRN